MVHYLQFISKVTVEEMGVDLLKLVALHSKTAWRWALVSCSSINLLLTTPPGFLTDSDTARRLLINHSTSGDGRPIPQKRNALF